jgi:hypothetical protein
METDLTSPRGRTVINQNTHAHTARALRVFVLHCIKSDAIETLSAFYCSLLLFVFGLCVSSQRAKNVCFRVYELSGRFSSNSLPRILFRQINEGRSVCGDEKCRPVFTTPETE